jgi:monoamine oxidase
VTPIPDQIDRRTFLRLGASCAAGIVVAGCGDPVGPGSPGLLGEGRPKQVLIVGAGVAGLVAAYELGLAGHEVTVLEARERIGGRVLSLRAPFADGHVAEAGAARIRPQDDLTLGYADHFGLPLDPFYPPTGHYVELVGGRRNVQSADAFRARRPDYVKVRGGTDRLVESFAAGFTGTLRIGTIVASVDQTGNRPFVTTSDGAVWEADRILVTAPLTVLDRIDFAPSLSGPKREASTGGFRYQTATRVFVRMSTRFWEEEGLNGWAVTDWPEELWHPTWDLTGPEGVLLTYVRGDRALELDALDEPSARAYLLEHWEEVFPGVSAHAGASVRHSWGSDPWSLAAWASPTSSQHAALSSEIGRVEGRIHFAGEHASADRGWMQGALASGLRAAREIHQS